MIISKDSCLFIEGMMYSTSVQQQSICSGDVSGSLCKSFFIFWTFLVIWIYVLYYCDFLLYYNSVIPESWTYDFKIYKQYI